MMWIPGHCWGCDRLRKTGHVTRWSSPHLPALLLHLKICSPPPWGAPNPRLRLAGMTTCFPLLFHLWLMIRQDLPPPLAHCHLQASQCCGHTSIVISPVTIVSCGPHNNSFHLERMVTQIMLDASIHIWRLEEQIENMYRILNAWARDICVNCGSCLVLWPTCSLIAHRSTQDQTDSAVRSLKETFIIHRSYINHSKTFTQLP